MNKFDHRNLAVRHDLYHLEENSPGMVFWHPRGFAIYRVLEDYIRKKLQRLNYEEVRTPQLLPLELWEQSGHWEKFGQNMYAIEKEGKRSKALKPMSCPCHIQIFKSGQKSWRDLPKRYSEFGFCHRDEPSGSMHGLLRSRAFEQDDAHVFCREQDVQSEISTFIFLLSTVYAELGFSEFSMALSTRPEVRFGTDAQWDWAEEELRKACQLSGIPFETQTGDGAFYGPKIEFALSDRQGRSWQCGTIQLDTVLPERLNAAYVSETSSNATPILIHHAVFGSMGRFIAILLEHHEGVLPHWIAPCQIALLPISDKQLEYAKQAELSLRSLGTRTDLLAGNDTLSRRILSAHELGISLIAIIGEKECKNNTITLRHRDGRQETLALEAARHTITDLCAAP